MDTRRRDRTHRPARIFTGPIDGGRFRTQPRRRPNLTNADRNRRRRRAASRRSAPVHRRLALVTLMVLAAALAIKLFLQHVPGSHHAIGLPGTQVARSTPVDEWRKGEVPRLYQIDPQWSQEPYAGGTVHENGCGPTCLSMAYVALTGKTDLDPAAMARFSEQNGFTIDGMTAWALMTDGAATLGLNGSELPAGNDSVREALEAGCPVICSVRPGDFTTTGHFIVLAGISGNGEVVVHDPNSASNSERSWELDRILGQCANLWSFSA